MMWVSGRAILCLAAAVVLGLAGNAMAAFPDKPIRLVIPYAGGGMGSVFGTTVSERLAARLSSPVYAEYKPGANGAIGTEIVARSPADGHTLLMVTTSTLTINPALYPKLSYDPLKDFTPVAMVLISRNVLYTYPEKASTLKDLIQLAASKPEGLSFGSLGIGTLGHLTGEMLRRQANINAIHIPFKGQGQVMTEVAAGRLDFAFGDPSGLQMAASGRVRALAVTGPQRIASAPNVPTLSELGFPGVGTLSWVGIVAPAGTPKNVVDRISAELKKAFDEDAVKAKMSSLGQDIASDMSPAYFDREIRGELERWKRFQADARISVE